MSKGLKGKFAIVLDSHGNRDNENSYWTIFSNDTALYNITVKKICESSPDMSYAKIATKEYGHYLLKWWKTRTQGLTAFW